MARRQREDFPGAIAHVTARGVEGRMIFVDADDCHRFLGLLRGVVARYAWRWNAYCLMGTHFHLLIRTPEAGLGAGMKLLNGAYAQGYNRRHGRRGHLFEERYHSVTVERESHLLELARYIALNPVRAGLCERPEAWRWSSYAATAGLAPAPPFLALEWLLGAFDEHARRARDTLTRFVHDGHV
jgi:putative transposase